MILTVLRKKYKQMSIPVKASLWYTICNVINKSIALLSTPIFTRILTEEQYGTFTIFQSWFSILIIFTSLNVFLGGYQKCVWTVKEINASDVFGIITYAGFGIVVITTKI